MTDEGAGHPPIAAPLGDVMTDRLDLRRFVASDLEGLAGVFSKPEVWEFPYGRAFSREETSDFLDTQMREWERCGFGLWVARDRESGRIIGYVGLVVPRFLPEILPAVEVGWRLEPEVWSRGLASEGANAALDHAFESLGLSEVCSIPQTDNPRSSAVCERIGMLLDRSVMLPPSSRRGSVEALLYRMTSSRWSALQSR